MTTDQDKEVVERLETETINMKELAQFERDKLETLISNVSYLGEEDNSGVYIDALLEIEERIAALNVPKLERSIQPKLRGAMKRVSDSLQQLHITADYNSSEDEDSIAFAFSGRQPAAADPYAHLR